MDASSRDSAAPAVVTESLVTGEPDPRAVAAERLTFFADAVIAIAITLLALDLWVPEGTTNRELLHSAYVHRADYIGFLISFYVIGAHWSGHHRVFRYVTRLGGRLSILTLLWLLMQVVTPFATRVLTGEGAFQTRFILYAVVQALAGLFFLLMVRQIQVHRLYRSDIPKDRFADAYFGTGSMAAAFLISIPLAFVTEYAYDVWIVVPIVVGLARRRVKRHYNDRTVPPG
jgi:uncharacterized membrane protein